MTDYTAECGQIYRKEAHWNGVEHVILLIPFDDDGDIATEDHTCPRCGEGIYHYNEYEQTRSMSY